MNSVDYAFRSNHIRHAASSTVSTLQNIVGEKSNNPCRNSQSRYHQKLTQIPMTAMLTGVDGDGPCIITNAPTVTLLRLVSTNQQSWRICLCVRPCRVKTELEVCSTTLATFGSTFISGLAQRDVGSGSNIRLCWVTVIESFLGYDAINFCRCVSGLADSTEFTAPPVRIFWNANSTLLASRADVSMKERLFSPAARQHSHWACQSYS